jgi:hypothetical protein
MTRVDTAFGREAAPAFGADGSRVTRCHFDSPVQVP